MMKTTQIMDRLFLVNSLPKYDLAMHFLRYQEFYESSHFAGKSFTLVDYMEWYANTHGNGVFTYPKDCLGYNIPGEIISKVAALGIPDPNKYDAAMWELHDLASGKPFYLIGVVDGDSATCAHEIAHGLYYLNDSYREQAKQLVTQLDAGVRGTMEEYLAYRGYARDVFTDETHAFLATGLPEKLSGVDWSGHRAPFIDLYTCYAGALAPGDTPR